MESLLVFIRLGLRRAWRGLLALLDRTGLTSMPPVVTILVALFVAVAVPMALGVDRRPAKLSDSRAREHLRVFGDQFLPDVSPEGPIYSVRPVFVWKAAPGATRYRFLLRDGTTLMHATDKVRREGDWVVYPLPAPAYLVPGHAYSFSVEADGIGPVAAATFSVIEQPAELTDLRAAAVNELDAADAAFVLAGKYAELGSAHDVRTALLRFLEHGGKSPDAPFARSILGLPAK